jgi:hypothetical protein
MLLVKHDSSELMWKINASNVLTIVLRRILFTSEGCYAWMTDVTIDKEQTICLHREIWSMIDCKICREYDQGYHCLQNVRMSHEITTRTRHLTVDWIFRACSKNSYLKFTLFNMPFDAIQLRKVHEKRLLFRTRKKTTTSY